MFSFEEKMLSQLNLLKKCYELYGIKAEFEAEGSMFKDLVRLRRITLQSGTKLFLKIGGVESKRDIRDALEIGVDGLIAPMVETAFGAKKFYDAYKSIYKNHKIFLTLNLETKTAIENMHSIVEYAEGKIDNITIGRSDLCGSFFPEKVDPNDYFIFETIKNASEIINKKSMSLTIGGSVNAKTIMFLKENPAFFDNICKLETRKVMLPKDSFLGKSSALKESLKFEKLYILSKKEFMDNYLESEINRLTELEKRVL